MQAYFAMQYQVLFHDTMAYGSHHHMVNLKFQNIARETLLFAGGTDAWRDPLKDRVLLTREAYSFNLAPVGLGEHVAILMTYEDPTRSTVRLCFRVMNEAGRPVSCGYQMMVVLDRETQRPVPAPLLMTRYLDATQGFSLLEAVRNPSFAERTRSGSVAVKDLFPEAVCALGRHIASRPLGRAHPTIIDTALVEYPL